MTPSFFFLIFIIIIICITFVIYCCEHIPHNYTLKGIWVRNWLCKCAVRIRVMLIFSIIPLRTIFYHITIISKTIKNPFSNTNSYLRWAYIFTNSLSPKITDDVSHNIIKIIIIYHTKKKYSNKLCKTLLCVVHFKVPLYTLTRHRHKSKNLKNKQIWKWSSSLSSFF